MSFVRIVFATSDDELASAVHRTVRYTMHDIELRLRGWHLALDFTQ